MKILNNYLWLMMSISLGCGTDPTLIDKAITIAIDRTDPLLLYPNAEAISAQLGLKQDMWQGIEVMVIFMQDTDSGESKRITLARESKWTGNTTIRKAKVEQFKKELGVALAPIKRSGSLGHSIIYRNIAKGLTALAACQATKKYLLVYSDLMENDQLNFYKPYTIDRIRKDPDSVRQRLEQIAAIPDLSGIQVWLLYQLPSYEANNSYRDVAHFYTQLLEAKGAVLHIENTFNP
jgi:hypothetical protein